MTEILYFTHLVFVGFVALFPPVNPIGTALVMDPFLQGLNSKERKSASSRIAVYCFFICAGTLVIGSWIFKLFGISIPIVQLAGGILICHMGWQLLSANSDGASDASSSAAASARTRNSHTAEEVEGTLFFPLAFPMTTGAGTISVLLTLSARNNPASSDWPKYLLGFSALLTAAVLMCVAIYLSYAYTPALLRRLGPRGAPIVNRLSAFLVFCVGLQIAVEGIIHLSQHHL